MTPSRRRKKPERRHQDSVQKALQTTMRLTGSREEGETFAGVTVERFEPSPHGCTYP